MQFQVIKPDSELLRHLYNTNIICRPVNSKQKEVRKTKIHKPKQYRINLSQIDLFPTIILLCLMDFSILNGASGAPISTVPDTISVGSSTKFCCSSSDVSKLYWYWKQAGHENYPPDPVLLENWHMCSNSGPTSIDNSRGRVSIQIDDDTYGKSCCVHLHEASIADAGEYMCFEGSYNLVSNKILVVQENLSNNSLTSTVGDLNTSNITENEEVTDYKSTRLLYTSGTPVSTSGGLDNVTEVRRVLEVDPSIGLLKSLNGKDAELPITIQDMPNELSTNAAPIDKLPARLPISLGTLVLNAIVIVAIVIVAIGLIFFVYWVRQRKQRKLGSQREAVIIYKPRTPNEEHCVKSKNISLKKRGKLSRSVSIDSYSTITIRTSEDAESLLK